MNSLVFCMFLAVASAASPKYVRVPFKDISTLNQRIINGTEAEPGQFPWQAQVKSESSWGSTGCGGALIKNGWILTAAHCLTGASIVTVILGSVKSSTFPWDDSLEISTREYFIHEYYDSVSLSNDIGLINLQQNVTLTDKIQNIELGQHLIENVLVRVSGWGQTEDLGSFSPTLQYVDLITITNKECEKVHGKLDENVVCCKGEYNESTCHGDSGGPVVVKTNEKWSHVAIVSFGHIDGGLLNYPVGFTRTAGYHDWIMNKINENKF